MNGTNQLTIGDEVWIATALLHREHPAQADFTRAQIEERVRSENIFGRFRAGVRPHIYVHAVANRPPNPGRLRMLFATGGDRRRLFRAGDPYHPDREGPADSGGRRVIPDREAIPQRYRDLVDWYLSAYSSGIPNGREVDPILALRGLGKSIWDEPADEYVQRLRADWA